MTETVGQAGMELWVLWLLAFLLGLAVGAALVFALGRVGPGRSRVQQELELSRQEMDRYRSSVDAHFRKTAELFETMSSHYRGIYQHMAEGAQTLCQPDEGSGRLGFSGDALPFDATSERPEAATASVQLPPDEVVRRSGGAA